STFALLAFLLLASACTRAPATPTPFPTYDPFVTSNGGSLPVQFEDSTNLVTHTPGPTPTRVYLSVTLPPTRDLSQPLKTPTPDLPRSLPTPRQGSEEYIVQAGDTLGSIADRYGISLQQLLDANRLTESSILSVGQSLSIPAPEPGAIGPSFKIIPDSELVYGPASALFDVEKFINEKAGYLAGYAQEVDGELLTGAQVITLVSQNYSVNPRLMLALLEYRSGWVTRTDVDTGNFPIAYVDDFHAGLYRQLTWAANELNRGFYLWRVNAASTWVLADGRVIPIDPTINAGTAGVQHFFSKIDGLEAWQKDVEAFGLFQTYYLMFLQSPFDYAVEPLRPASLQQPHMILPFEHGDTWSFTGGPHGGWDNGSAWAAVDFAPPSEELGCTQSNVWETAVADGLIVRAANGAVIQDLDNDGFEQTGWVVLYMHVETRDRVQPGTYLSAGERIGHPSCEGGVSNGTHLHLARRYNGEWISADGPIPFNLDGWESSGDGVEYDGYFSRGSQRIEAWEGVIDINQISR
ncbi:MAG TPA: LysM peptidoglycan-binding domain-containing protein, partial [Anaerolineales bacterium]